MNEDEWAQQEDETDEEWAARTTAAMYDDLQDCHSRLEERTRGLEKEVSALKSENRKLKRENKRLHKAQVPTATP